MTQTIQQIKSSLIVSHHGFFERVRKLQALNEFHVKITFVMMTDWKLWIRIYVNFAYAMIIDGAKENPSSEVKSN